LLIDARLAAEFGHAMAKTFAMLSLTFIVVCEGFLGALDAIFVGCWFLTTPRGAEVPCRAMVTVYGCHLSTRLLCFLISFQKQLRPDIIRLYQLPGTGLGRTVYIVLAV
jgi:hypothetical protein